MIDDGGQTCPAWAGEARAADLVPGGRRPEVIRVVNRHTRVGVGVKGDVGDRTVGEPQGGLIRRSRLDLADAAAAARPGRLRVVAVVRVEIKGRSADGDDIGGVSRIFAWRAAVAGRGQECHPVVTGGRGEDRVECRLLREFAASKAHRDGRDSRKRRRGWHGCLNQIQCSRSVGFDEDDVRHGSDRVSPLDVKRFLDAPAPLYVGRGQWTCLPILIHFREARRVGKAVLLVEGVKVARGGRPVVGVNDRDRLTRSIADNIAEHDLVDAVSLANLRGGVSDWPGGPIERDPVGVLRDLKGRPEVRRVQERSIFEKVNRQIGAV